MSSQNFIADQYASLIESGGGGATNLAINNKTASTLDVTSSTGTNATVPAATTSEAGLMSASDKTKLDGIETSAKDDQNAAEVSVAASPTNYTPGSATVEAHLAAIDAALPANLSIANKTSTTLDIASSTGTDATVPEATTSEAGLLSALGKTRLNALAGISDTNAVFVDPVAGVGDYQTIGAAIAYINSQTPSISNIFHLYISPGEYVEDITWPDYTWVIGHKGPTSGERYNFETVIKPLSAVGHDFTGSGGVTVFKNISFSWSTTLAAPMFSIGGSGQTSFHDCVFSSFDSSSSNSELIELDSSSTYNLVFNNCTVGIASDAKFLVTKGTGSHAIQLEHCIFNGAAFEIDQDEDNGHNLSARFCTFDTDGSALTIFDFEGNLLYFYHCDILGQAADADTLTVHPSGNARTGNISLAFYHSHIKGGVTYDTANASGTNTITMGGLSAVNTSLYTYTTDTPDIVWEDYNAVSTGYTIQTITSGTYTVDVIDDLILVNNSSAATTAITLPAISGFRGDTLIIKDIKGDAGTYNVTITPDGAETIDGAASYLLSSDYESVTLAPHGTNWSVI